MYNQTYILKQKQTKKLELEVKECKDKIQRLKTWASSREGQVAPSMDKEQRETAIAHEVLAPGVGKLYSEAVPAGDSSVKRYKLMISSKTNQSGDAIKNIIKANVNPASLKV